MNRVFFLLVAVPIALFLILGVFLGSVAGNLIRRAQGKKVERILSAKSARFCDRLKEWVIEHE
jgi:hypothetical protein